LCKDYEIDIFGSFAYKFELSQFLAKSFACAHGEIKSLRLWRNILLKQNMKLNPLTTAAISLEQSENFTLRSNISPTRKGGFN